MSLTEISIPPHSLARLRATLGKTALKPALGAAIAVGVLGAGQAHALVVQVNNQSWNVTTFTGSFNANLDKFKGPGQGGVTPWIGSDATAVAFTNAVDNYFGNVNPGFISPSYGSGGYVSALFITDYTVNSIVVGYANRNTIPAVLGQRWASLVATANNSSQPGVAFADQNLVWAQATLVETPGPLPILGAFAAFGTSRKLRKRIKASKAVGASISAS